MKSKSFNKQSRWDKVWTFTVISLLLTCGAVQAEKNYVRNGNFEQVKNNKLLDWEFAGKVNPEAVGGVWRRYTVKFNSRKYHGVNFYFAVAKASIGSIWIDNITSSQIQIKNASFEENNDGCLGPWSVMSKINNWNVTLFSDSTRASDGKKSVRITFKNEQVPRTCLWQHFPVEPNQEYAISYDVFIGDDFQGEARGLVYSGKDHSVHAHLTSNYEETSVSGQLATRDRCEKYAAVMAATEAVPADLFQQIKVEPEMNLQASVDICNKTFKGILSFLIEDIVSGEILKKMDVKDVKDKWQTLQMRFQTKSSKIRIRLSARGEGMLQTDNIAVTFPEVVPPLQKVQWLSSLENFSIPSQLKVSVEGQSGKAIDGGLELLSNDLKKHGVVLEKVESKKAPLQILIGAKYALTGKGDESYALKITKKGITIKAGKESGAFYGLMTLLQLIEKQKDKLMVLACNITDYPDMQLRAVLYGNPEQAARWKMNTLQHSTGYPTSAKEREALRKFVLKCQKLNLDVIPRFMTLVGGYYVQQKNPNLAAGIWVKGEKITLHGTKPSFLTNKRVIRTKMTDVKLRSSNSKMYYKLGKDYEVINGDIAYPYNQSESGLKSFAVVRISGSSIPDGATVLASYDYVSKYRKSTGRTEAHVAYCPVEPETQKLMGEFMKNLAKDYPFSFIHPMHCLYEFRPAEAQLETDSRIFKSGKRPIELFADDVCFLDKAAKSGNSEVRILLWAGSVNDYCRAVGPKLPKDTLIGVWGYDANWPAVYGREAITYWSKLGFETSVMAWDNLRNVRGWAQVVAEAREKGYPCIGMTVGCWFKRYGGIKETAIVSWKIPKKGERGFVLLKTPQKVKNTFVDSPVKAEERLGKEMLVNGDFEQGNPPQKWKAAFDVVLSRDINPHSGKYCLKTVRQEKQGYVRQDVFPVPGKKYKLTLWYKCEPGSTARISIYDLANSKPLFAEHKTDYMWTKYERIITIPTSCGEKVGVMLYPFDSDSIVWFDDVSFKEIEE